MAVVFGVHVGNTSACLASYKDGRIDVIANDVGDRITPTVVAVTSTEKIVGCAAKAGLVRNSPSTVIHNKRFLNDNVYTEEEYEEISRQTPYKIEKEGSCIKYVLKSGEKNHTISVETVAICIYSKLFEIASSSGKSDCDIKTVLCVPLHFSEASRVAMMRAAEESGFEVLQVISEPAATLLGYGLGIQNPEEELNCLVYRLGGATLDVSIMEVRAGMYTVHSSVRKTLLGGDSFTKMLAEYLAEEYRKKCKLDPLESRRSMAKLTAAAETCKHVLSTVGTAHCFVESLCEGVDFSYNITRARFENLIAPILSQYTDPIKDALQEAHMDSSDIQKVLLSGGSVKIPKVQQTIRDIFSHAEVCLNGISPDEVIALGAAKQASYLSRAIDPDCQYLARELPATSASIHVKSESLETSDCVIPALTPVPVKRARKYKINAVHKDVDDVSFELFESSESDADRYLGKISLGSVNLPTEVSLEINLNSVGGLVAVLTDVQNQKKVNLKLDAPIT